MSRPSTGTLLVLAAMAVVLIVETRTLLALLGIHVSWITGVAIGTALVALVFAWALLARRRERNRDSNDKSTQPKASD